MHQAEEKRRWRFLSFAARATGLAAAFLTAAIGCGDGPICASDIVVLIETFGDGEVISDDVSPDPGIQIDVPVRSNLKEGDAFTLEVVDADGSVVGTATTTSDGNGDAVFTGVTVPTGAVTLRVEGRSEEGCGSEIDERQVTVLGDSLCTLSVREGLIENDYYAPLPVLNSTNDSDPNAEDFQINVDISTGGAFDVELFVLDVDSANETSMGVITADGAGQASFAFTLAQGRQALRAACVSADGQTSASSQSTAVFVDTRIPACDISYPSEGSSIIPEMDTDGDPNNGVQLTLIGNADPVDGDVEGESAVFTIDGADTSGTDLDQAGDSTAMAGFDTPGTYTLGFQTQDHAGNTCTVEHMHEYIVDGCAITLVAPTAPVTSDFDANPNNGFQAEVSVQIDPACAGRPVTTDCGLDTTNTTASGAGTTDIEVTMCTEALCEVTDQCTISVINQAGIQTSVGAEIIADNLPPSVSLEFVDPITSCGGAVAPSDDVDGNPGNGVQIDVRVLAPLAAVRTIELTNSMGTNLIAAGVGGDATITLEPGNNNVVALAEDDNGNVGQTGPCNVSLLDIVVDFDPPIADGLVGAPDGVVGAGDLTLDLCGTVSEAGATVEVSINGGPLQMATVMGLTWCLNGVTLPESPPDHTIDVTATVGMRMGIGSLTLTVDLTAPNGIGGLTAFAPNRQAVELGWLAGDDGGLPVDAYIIKYDTAPLDDANFDANGMEVPGPMPPQNPGAMETHRIQQLNAGTSYYFAVATRDAAGNRSVAQTIGPVVPDFDATGSVLPVSPADGDNALGFQLARGDFNGDGDSDVAVAAPYKSVAGQAGAGTVYVYFGGAGGLGNPITPDVTIEGAGVGSQFGNAIAAGDVGGDAADDLIVGAPFADNSQGRVYIFHGGANFSLATGIGDADAQIGSGGGWFADGYMGWSLATGRFDNDANDDVIIGVPGGGGGQGGVAIVFGGSGETTILLDDTDPMGSGNAKTMVITDPEPNPWDFFGFWVYNLGPTEGMGDSDDDIGIAYFDSPSAYVIRGRAQPVPAGVTLAMVDTMNDLEMQNNATDTVSVFFGSAMGSIDDQNGDGAREIVIGQWGEGPYNGRVSIVDGDEVGAQNIGSAPFLLTQINRGVGTRALGSAIVNNATAEVSPDVNNDGLEDLIIVGGSRVMGTVPVSAFIWYGGTIPTGTITTDSADHAVVAPLTFTGDPPGAGGTPIVAIWGGDVNNDDLEDICWGDHIGNGADGSFEVLWDDGQ